MAIIGSIIDIIPGGLMGVGAKVRKMIMIEGIDDADEVWLVGRGGLWGLRYGRVMVFGLRLGYGSKDGMVETQQLSFQPRESRLEYH
jgi:hypothetical protein